MASACKTQVTRPSHDTPIVPQWQGQLLEIHHLAAFSGGTSFPECKSTCLWHQKTVDRHAFCFQFSTIFYGGNSSNNNRNIWLPSFFRTFQLSVGVHRWELSRGEVFAIADFCLFVLRMLGKLHPEFSGILLLGSYQLNFFQPYLQGSIIMLGI